MSTPRLPGYTAESSLYPSKEQSRMIGISVVVPDGRRILPQQYCYASGSDICCCMWGVCQCRRRPDLLWQ
jgi:hypothetical protein